jgi:hypothetical protein
MLPIGSKFGGAGVSLEEQIECHSQHVRSRQFGIGSHLGEKLSGLDTHNCDCCDIDRKVMKCSMDHVLILVWMNRTTGWFLDGKLYILRDRDQRSPRIKNIELRAERQLGHY